MKEEEEERQQWHRSTKEMVNGWKGWGVQGVKVMKQAVVIRSRDDNVSTVTTLITPFSHLPISLSLSVCWRLSLPTPLLSLRSFTLGWKPNGWALILPLQPRTSWLQPQGHFRKWDCGGKSSKAQERRKKTASDSEREKAQRERDYENEMECVGRSLTRHLMFSCRRWKMLCKDGTQTDWL